MAILINEHLQKGNKDAMSFILVVRKLWNKKPKGKLLTSAPLNFLCYRTFA